MKKNLSTRGAAALLALAMGYMGQGVAQAAYIHPKSAQPIEELEFDINCFDMHFYYGANMMTNLHWAGVYRPDYEEAGCWAGPNQ